MSHYFHAEAQALSGKLMLPFEEEIKAQAFVKLEGESEELLLEGDSEELRKKRAQRNYLSQHAKNFRLEGIISYSAAHTQVSGHGSKRHPGRFVTLATSSVENLNILNVVTADRVVAQVSTTHFPGQYSPEVTFLGTHFENLRIAGHKTEPVLKLDFAGKRPEGYRAVYPVKGTGLMASVERMYKKLRADFNEVRADLQQEYLRRLDADDSWYSKQYRKFDNFNYDELQKSADEGLRHTAREAAEKNSSPPNGNWWDRVTCSLVEHVEVEDNKIERKHADPLVIPPPARIFGHVIYVPDFGTIFLAELTVNHNSFHLTMIRLELGCIADGNVSIVTCSVNGHGAGGGGGNGGGNGRDLADDDANRVSPIAEGAEQVESTGAALSEPMAEPAETAQAALLPVVVPAAIRESEISEPSATGAEPVDTAVFCPPHVPRNSVFLAQVFLYSPPAAMQVYRQAREADETAQRRGTFSLPLDLPLETRVDLHLEIPGLSVAEPDAMVVWRGSPTAAQFEVAVPANAAGVGVIGRVRIAVAGVPAGTLRFQVTLTAVGTSPGAVDVLELRARRYRRAFVSYSSQDRAEVLRRVQAFRIAGLSVFQDILDLDPGERWQKAIYHEIDNCDLFLLFWSHAAADSEWVGKEIEYALARKGGDEEQPPDIQPVPIEGPPIAPPPVSLSNLHFNDALLAQINAAEKARYGRAAAHELKD